MSLRMVREVTPSRAASSAEVQSRRSCSSDSRRSRRAEVSSIRPSWPGGSTVRRAGAPWRGTEPARYRRGVPATGIDLVRFTASLMEAEDLRALEERYLAGFGRLLGVR